MLQQWFRRLKLNWLNKLRPVMESGEKLEKRPLSDDATASNETSKKQKTEVSQDRKRKCAIMFGYNGKGYYGLQRNPGFHSIEEDLCKALLDAQLIPVDHFEYMQKMSFQRAARTDKGVSAAGNLVSLKMLVNKENLVDEINAHLPSQIRVFDCFRTTQNFNSKNYCDARTYIYILPTYAFLHKDEPLNLNFKLNADLLEKANVVLDMFKGTHNFHNYTSGMLPRDSKAKRFIMEFECRTPFVRHGIEFCEISVKGQSFVMHHIRKMVGTTIAVLKGYIEPEFIEDTFKHEKICLPKAPGLGLVLDKLHYPMYNKRYGNTHTTIDYEKIKNKVDPFKEEFILADIYKTEAEEYSMLKWLPELEAFTFEVERDPTRETVFTEGLTKQREQRLLMTNKFIYGDDYVPPEPTKVSDETKLPSNQTTNQDVSCDNLTNDDICDKFSNETEVKEDSSTNQDSVNDNLTDENQSAENCTSNNDTDEVQDSVNEKADINQGDSVVSGKTTVGDVS